VYQTTFDSFTWISATVGFTLEQNVCEAEFVVGVGVFPFVAVIVTGLKLPDSFKQVVSELNPT